MLAKYALLTFALVATQLIATYLVQHTYKSEVRTFSMLAKYALLTFALVATQLIATYLVQHLQTSSTTPSFPPCFLTLISAVFLILSFPIYSIKNHILATRVNAVPITLQILVLSVLRFAAHYLFTLSLRYTFISSVLTIQQSITLIVFLLSVMFLGEEFTLIKAFFVVISVSGVVVLVLGDAETPVSPVFTEAVLGDCMVLVSSCGVAVYMIYLKNYTENSDIDTFWLLGSIGSVSTLIFLPLTVILHITDIEVIPRVNAGSAVLLIVKGLMGFLFNIAVFVAIIVTTPIFTRLAMSCTVPVGFVIAVVFIGDPVNAWRVIGGSAVVLAFLGFLRLIYQEQQSQHNSDEKQNAE